MPRTGKGIYRIGDQPHVLTKSDRHSAVQTDAAEALTAFLSGLEVMALIAEGCGSVPVQRKVLNGDRYLRKPPARMLNVPKMVDEARCGVPWFNGIGDWRGPINAELNDA